MENMFQKYNSVLESILDGSSQPTQLPISLLECMTDNFSDERIAGSGGYGVVYRGEFRNRTIAVKKLTFNEEADKHFDREIENLMRVRHENVIQFLGYCNNIKGTFENVANPGEPERRSFVYRQERILCFDYISNGSLSDHIQDELRGLEWHTRYRILKGICQGLKYLHNKENLVHRDLKPDNILIDNLWVPKLADLGISKHLGDGKTHTKTSNARSSQGYTAPEFTELVVSFKYDIYSLGVIFIEMVTGVKNKPDVRNVLTRWTHRWNKSNETMRYHQVAKCIEIGLLCQHKRPQKRPSILKIIKDLDDIDGVNGENRQVIPSWNDLLWVEPPEMFFPFQINKKVSCSLELHNKVDAYMAFYIKTYSYMKYEIDPIKGIIQPRSHSTVSITLVAQQEAPEKMWKADEFIIKSKEVNEGLRAEEITKEIFSKKSSNVVDRVSIGVVFDKEKRAPCCICEEPEEDLSLTPLEISGSQETGETSCISTQSLCDLNKVIDFPSMHDKKQYTLSGSAHVEVIDEEPTIVPPNSDGSSSQSGTTQVEVSDEEPPDSDESALRSGPALVEVTDEEPTIVPPISDDSCQDVDETNPGIEPGSLELVIKYGERVPWEGSFKQRVLLEFTGSDYTNTRPGLDLVAVLDTSGDIRDAWVQEVKTAMRFVLQKLGPMDRLSIVIFSAIATELCPLRQITEASRRELEEVIEGLKDSGDHYSIKMNRGLLAGLKVLADHREEVKGKGGRVAAIMLVARHEEWARTSICKAAGVSIRDVPVYTFGVRETRYAEYRFLNEVSALSMGGTFSYVEGQYGGGLTMALSQCLAGLLTVAVWDLLVTVTAVEDESALLYLAARRRLYNPKSARPTIWFGNVYSREVRRLIVDVGLPAVAVDSERSADILNVTYSYITCCRLNSSADGLTVRGGRRVGNSHIVDEAADFETRVDRLRTPRMDTYLKQARKFYKDPAMLLPSADDDVKDSDSRRRRIEVSDEEPPNSDESALRSGPAHIKVNDEEPTIMPPISGTTSTPTEPGRVQLVIKSNKTAPLLEYKQTVMLELTGGDDTSDRPGLDLVLVVDVGSSMQGEQMKELQTAMLFVVGKLSPIDRLSIVTYSYAATELCFLRQVTETSRRELVEIIYRIKGSAHASNIEDGLLTGLKVLAHRNLRTNRVAAIILICHNPKSTGTATKVSVGNVPVYTFGFGSESDHIVLSTVAANSMGGTFSHIQDEELNGGLTMALSQCLAGLLTVSVQELELTVATVGAESRIVKTTAGSYPQSQLKEGSGSVTVRFGNLYSSEVRKVIVDIRFAACEIDHSFEFLKVTCSYNSSSSSGGRERFVRPLTVWRTDVGAHILEEKLWLTELQAEKARLQAAELIKKAAQWANVSLAQAHQMLVDAQKLVMLDEGSNPQLTTELQELNQLFQTKETYMKQGCAYAFSLVSSHNRQRYAARGSNVGMTRLFATPCMDMYLEEARKIYQDTTLRSHTATQDTAPPAQAQDTTHLEDCASPGNYLTAGDAAGNPPPGDYFTAGDAQGDLPPGSYFVGRPANNEDHPKQGGGRRLWPWRRRR